MRTPYPLIPIVVIILFIYFFTFWCVRLKLLGKDVQRKLWNTILLITFLITALLGILLTIQINYKIEFSFVKQILFWHVNFGIAMTIVAIIHVIWHLRYYRNLFKNPERNLSWQKNKTVYNDAKELTNPYVFLVLLGFVTSIVQVLILRECLKLFYSIEFIMGIILALWMTLTGLGAWLGKNIEKIGSSKIFFSFLILSLMPLLFVIGLIFLKNIFFPPGVLIGFWEFILVIILLLAPNCLLSGFLFSSLSKKTGKLNGSKSYIYETIGSIIGGIVVSFIMILWLNSLQSLAVVFIITSLISVIFLPHPNKLINASVISFCAVVFITFFFTNADLSIRKFLYPNQKIIFSHETPYGNITMTEMAGQINVFENMSLLFTTENTMENEETIHFPMLQMKSPENVLLISGGTAGTIKEILKYSSVQHLTYIESNPWLLKYAGKYFKMPSDMRLKTVVKDPRRFLESDTSKYDVVVVSLPEPSTLQFNRFYTLEFIGFLKRHTNSSAIISLSLPSSENYMNEESRNLHSSLFNTLKKAFRNVLIIPGEKDYFLASDKNLESSIGKLYRIRNVQNDYINSYFVDDVSLTERSNSLLNKIDPNVPVNTDFKPVATLFQTVLFFNKFNVNYIILISILGVLLLLPLFRLNAITFSVYATGCTASALEMIVILAFQIIFGYIYAAAGIIFALFMAGLTVGAWLGYKWRKTIQPRTVFNLQTVVLVLAIIIPLALSSLHFLEIEIFKYIIIVILTVLPAFVSGFQFSVVIKLSRDLSSVSTGFLYGADLLGSAIGLLLVTIVLLPLTGIIGTVAFIVFINFCSMLVYYKKRAI